MSSNHVNESFEHQDLLKDIKSKGETLVKCYKVNLKAKTQVRVMMRTHSHLITQEGSSLNVVDMLYYSIHIWNNIPMLTSHDKGWMKNDKFTFKPYYSNKNDYEKN